jgi:hypothetical protein
MFGRQENHDHRSERFQFSDRVRILSDRSPWRFCLKATAMNVSATGILLRLSQDSLLLDPSQGMVRQDLADLFPIGQDFVLQMEEIDEESDFQTRLMSKLTRREFGDNHIDLGFYIDEECDEELNEILSIARSRIKKSSPSAYAPARKRSRKAFPKEDEI